MGWCHLRLPRSLDLSLSRSLDLSISRLVSRSLGRSLGLSLGLSPLGLARSFWFLFEGCFMFCAVSVCSTPLRRSPLLCLCGVHQGRNMVVNHTRRFRCTLDGHPAVWCGENKRKRFYSQSVSSSRPRTHTRATNSRRRIAHCYCVARRLDGKPGVTKQQLHWLVPPMHAPTTKRGHSFPTQHRRAWNKPHVLQRPSPSLGTWGASVQRFLPQLPCGRAASEHATQPPPPTDVTNCV